MSDLATPGQTYVFGQTFSDVDTVMFLVDGVFDPQNPRSGAIVLNDDTDAADHRVTLLTTTISGSNFDPSDPNGLGYIECSTTQIDYCPQVSFVLDPGDVVSIVITTYSGSNPGPPSSLGSSQVFYAVGAGTFATTSTGLTAPATLEQELQAIIEDEAVRALRSDIAANVRMTRAARERLMENLRREAACAAEAAAEGLDPTSLRADCGSGLATRNQIPFRVTGSADVSNGILSTQGSFFGQRSTFSGASRRLVFGDFDVQSDPSTNSTTATIFGRVAWEQTVSPQTMVGYFVGAEIGNSRIRSTTLAGSNVRYSTTAGVYTAHHFGDEVYGDAFVSFGIGRNDLELGDTAETVTGNYTTRTATLGGSVSGSIDREGYEIRPELSFTYGQTWLGTVGMIGTSSGSLSIDGGSVSVGQLIFRPEFRFPLDQLPIEQSRSILSLTPRALCESLKTTDRRSGCGAGAEIAIRSGSLDGLTQISASITADRVINRTRSTLALGLAHRF